MRQDSRVAKRVGVGSGHIERRRNSEAGDTLIEVLIALMVLGTASVALLIAFATTISASAEHRNLATYNTVLTTASQAVISAYQTSPSLFQCPGSNPSVTLPSPYASDSVRYDAVQYWTGTAFTSSCQAYAPEKITIGVTGIPAADINTFVVDYPLSSSDSVANTDSATSLIFYQQPGAAVSGVPLGSSSEPIIEMMVGGGPASSDLSAVTFTLNTVSGSAGATVSGCSGSPSSGFITYTGCAVTTVNNTSGTFTLTATTPAGLTATSNVFAVSVATNFLSFSQGGGRQPAGGVSGTAFATAPVAAVVDYSSGNVDSLWTGTITFTVSGGLLSCPGTSSTTSVTVSTTNGVATLPTTPSVCSFAGGYYYNPISQVRLATPYTMTATASGSLAAVPVMSNTFAVSSYGTATQLVFSAQPSGVDSASPTAIFPGQPAITVEDSFGNVVTSANYATNPVNLTISGAETLSGSGCSSSTSNWSNGVDTFAGCYGSAYGVGLTLTASSTGLASATSINFNISGVATHLVFVTQPKAGVSGATLTTEPAIAFEDSAGRVVTSSTSAVTLTPSGGTLSLCTRLVPTSGLATVANCTFTGLVGTPYTLTASATNSVGAVITSVPSSSFTPIAPGAPSQLVFSTQPVAGVSTSVLTVQPVISVEDVAGNVLTSSTLGISLTAPYGTLSSCTGLSAVAGVINVGNCTFAGVVGTSYSLTATATSGSLTPGTSGNFSPTGPGPVSAAVSTVSAAPTSIIDNGIATSTVTVTLEDSYGNVIAGKSVSLSAGGGSSTINVVSGTTAASGIASFSVSDLNVETVVYTATDATDSVTISQTTSVNFISHPTVTSTTPSSRFQGATNQNIAITGTGFVTGAAVTFSGTGITVNSTTFVSSTSLTANITITSGATTGTRNVTVTNPDTGVGTGTGIFTVNAAPTVTSTTPSSQDDGATSQNITITGTNFVIGAVASFSGTGITVNSTTFVNSTSLTANITIASGATTGARSVTVTDPDTGAGTGTGIFTVNAAPTVTSTTPSSQDDGATSQNITITGTNFVTGTSLATSFSGTGITVNSTTFVSSTSLTANITITSAAPTGPRNVTLTNGDGTSATGTGLFTVNGAPTVTSTTPSWLGQGATSQNILITGTNFVTGTSLATSFSGTGITVNSTTFASSTSLTANITITSGAPTGTRNVTLTNGDGTTATGTGIFTVVSKFANLSDSANPGYANGALTTGVSGPSSLGSTAVSFPGTTGSFVSTTTQITNPESFSIVAWFKTSSVSGGTIIGFTNLQGNGAPGTWDRGLWIDNSGYLVWGVNPTGSLPQEVTSPSAYNNGQWHMVVAEIGSAGQQLWVDGTKVASNGAITAAQNYNGYWHLGWTSELYWNDAPTNSYLAGSLSETAVIPTQLTLAQIGTLYNETSAANEVGYVTSTLSATEYWPLTDGGSTSSPTVTSTTPSSLAHGTTSQNVTITGTNFVTGAVASFSGTGITVNSTTFVSSTSLTANITITSGATTGARSVTVTDPAYVAGTGTGIFTVT